MTRRTSCAIEKPNLTLGFIPLVDCAPLVVAQEHGWFRAQGLSVELSREASWANVRDKVGAGLLDGAHMLAPMPLASALDPSQPALVTGLGLSLNGNAITVSAGLYRRMQELDSESLQPYPIRARALRRVLDQDRAQGRPPRTLAHVFPASSHHYLLRYWLAADGIDPDRDVRLVVVPPVQMVTQLEQGRIDGYCVGAPWSEMAESLGIGRTVVTTGALWNNHPEKVFGVSRIWAERHPETHRAVLRALMQASRWLDRPENLEETAELLALSAYVHAPKRLLLQALGGGFGDRGHTAAPVFHRQAAGFPWHSQAAWFVSQMRRWGESGIQENLSGLLARTYRTDLFRQAAADVDIPCPTADSRLEGSHGQAWTLTAASAPMGMGPDLFFDGQVLDMESVLVDANGNRPESAWHLRDFDGVQSVPGAERS